MTLCVTNTSFRDINVSLHVTNTSLQNIRVTLQPNTARTIEKLLEVVVNIDLLFDAMSIV